MNVDATSRGIDVNTTSFWHHMPTGITLHAFYDEIVTQLLRLHCEHFIQPMYTVSLHSLHFFTAKACHDDRNLFHLFMFHGFSVILISDDSLIIHFLSRQQGHLTKFSSVQFGSHQKLLVKELATLHDLQVGLSQ